MSDSSTRASFLWYPGMLAAFFVTAVLGVITAIWLPPHSRTQTRERTNTTTIDRRTVTPLGVHARLEQGSLLIERDLPALAFALGEGESLDMRLDADAFTGTFEVTFDPGRVRSARIGAQIQGGQLIVKRADEVLVSDAATADPVEVLSSMSQRFGSGPATLTYEFTRTSAAPAVLRAIWQPDDSLIPMPLFGTGAALQREPALRGTVHIQQMQCTACHVPQDERVASLLTTGSAPDLGAIGARVRPSWLRAWIEDPHTVRPDTRMPHLGHSDLLTDDEKEDLVHFLVSRGGPIVIEPREPDADLTRTGMLAYHTVGCFACHGPLESPNQVVTAQAVTAKPQADYAALGHPAGKTTIAQLAAFLESPLESRPDGRMPDMALSTIEAEAIATYLVERDHSASGTTPPESFTLEPARATRGAQIFGQLGCVSCHAVDDVTERYALADRAPAIESLAKRMDAGCLADTPPVGVPDYALETYEKDDIRAALGEFANARSATPIDRLATDLLRMQCTACHAYRSDRGAESAALAFFATREEADLGDEGRVPPDLSDAGGRLTTSWMRDVLTEDQRARPYMATRMPIFGEENVGHLPELFAAASGASASIDHEPEFTVDLARAGRRLVGSRGLNCIQCHEIAGRPSTGTPGPDLALMPGRLRHDFFDRWLHDPTRVVPGTRMPRFFVAGLSTQRDELGGRPQPQIDAMWCYLSQGDALALPEGLPDPQGLELTVGEEPIVFRSFMASSGVRAIACGFPEQIHCAFDADRCELTAIWNGRFLNAAGAWAARGGSETNPDGIQWSASPDATLELLGAHDAARVAHRFRGYRLDAARRPIFRYTLRRGDVSVDVEEQPLPVGDGAVPTMRRVMTLTGPAGARVAVRPGVFTVRGDGAAPVGGPTDQGRMIFTLGPDGTRRIELELTP